MTDCYDYAIVGAGPAGSHLSYLLSSRGLRVVLFDWHIHSEKPCGGGITPRTYRRFPFLEHLPITKNEVLFGEFISPRNRVSLIRGKSPMYIFSRNALDSYLREKAAKANAFVINERIVDFYRNSRQWIIQGEKSEYKARFLVGADGTNSIVRKKILGRIAPINLSMTAGYYIKGFCGNTAILKFSNLHGYIWVFPRTDHASAGIGAPFGKNGNELFSILTDFLNEKFGNNISYIKKWFALIPAVRDGDFFKLPCGGKRWAVIGDAAGHVDPLTGEGILFSIWSAELLGEAILEGFPQRYDEKWREEYGKDLIRATKLSSFFYDSRIMELLIRWSTRSEDMGEWLLDFFTARESFKVSFSDFVRKLPRVISRTLFP